MKHIVSIGFKIPSENDDLSLKFDSNYSLADADIILFRPNFEGCQYFSEYNTPTHNGKKLYSKDSSFRIKEDTDRWKSELANAFNVGKTIAILLNKKDDFFIHTGKNQTSGTGKNQKVTNIVEPYSNYSFLPSKDIKIVHSVGSSVFCINPKFENFYNALKGNLVAENYIEGPTEIGEAFSTKNKERKLGFYLKGQKNGIIIFLPNILPQEKELKRESKNLKKWSKESLEFGKKLQFHLIELDKNLRRQNHHSINRKDRASLPVYL